MPLVGNRTIFHILLQRRAVWSKNMVNSLSSVVRIRKFAAGHKAITRRGDMGANPIGSTI